MCVTAGGQAPVGEHHHHDVEIIHATSPPRPATDPGESGQCPDLARAEADRCRQSGEGSASDEPHAIRDQSGAEVELSRMTVQNIM